MMLRVSTHYDLEKHKFIFVFNGKNIQIFLLLWQLVVIVDPYVKDYSQEFK